MRVGQTGNNPVQNAEAAQASEAKKAQRAKLNSETEKVNAPGVETAEGASSEISARGKEFAKAKAIAESVPDIREERIAKLKEKIAAGKYKVDADKLAEKMVDEHMKTAVS